MTPSTQKLAHVKLLSTSNLSRIEVVYGNVKDIRVFLTVSNVSNPSAPIYKQSVLLDFIQLTSGYTVTEFEANQDIPQDTMELFLSICHTNRLHENTNSQYSSNSRPFTQTPSSTINISMNQTDDIASLPDPFQQIFRDLMRISNPSSFNRAEMPNFIRNMNNALHIIRPDVFDPFDPENLTNDGLNNNLTNSLNNGLNNNLTNSLNNGLSNQSQPPYFTSYTPYSFPHQQTESKGPTFLPLFLQNLARPITSYPMGQTSTSTSTLQSSPTQAPTQPTMQSTQQSSTQPTMHRPASQPSTAINNLPTFSQMVADIFRILPSAENLDITNNSQNTRPSSRIVPVNMNNQPSNINTDDINNSDPPERFVTNNSNRRREIVMHQPTDDNQDNAHDSNQNNNQDNNQNNLEQNEEKDQHNINSLPSQRSLYANLPQRNQLQLNTIAHLARTVKRIIDTTNVKAPDFTLTSRVGYRKIKNFVHNITKVWLTQNEIDLFVKELLQNHEENKE